MPVTWCYRADQGLFCSTGFPIGCYVTPSGKAKDACVINVSSKKNVLEPYIAISPPKSV